MAEADLKSVAVGASLHLMAQLGPPFLLGPQRLLLRAAWPGRQGPGVHHLPPALCWGVCTNTDDNNSRNKDKIITTTIMIMIMMMMMTMMMILVVVVVVTALIVMLVIIIFTALSSS